MTDRTKAMDNLIAQDADLIDQENAETFTRPENVQTKPEKLGMGDDALVLELTNEIMGRTATVAARAILPLIEADREAVRAYWYRQGKHDGWQMCKENEIDRLREELAEAYIELSGKSIHASDCATSNAPAMDPGPCNCDALGESHD
jgi:hypothetical protein